MPSAPLTDPVSNRVAAWLGRAFQVFHPILPFFVIDTQCLPYFSTATCRLDSPLSIHTTSFGIHYLAMMIIIEKDKVVISRIDPVLVGDNMRYT